MMTSKKVFSFAGITATALLLAACGGNDSEPVTGTGANGATPGGGGTAATSDEQIVLRFAHWNDSPIERFDEVVTLPDNVTIEWIHNPHDNNMHLNAVIQMLQTDNVDLFVVDVDSLRVFVESDFIADVRDLGLTDADLAYMFDYTLDVATDDSGVLRGVSWEANPGLFVYRRSIAEAVFGTDDPAVIQGYVSNWDNFLAAASRLAAYDYSIVAGPNDPYRVFSNNLQGPWVNENNELHIDPHMMNWVDHMKTMVDNGYINPGVSLWSAEWVQGVGSEGRVFGYFHAPWGISFIMTGQSLDDPNGPHEVGNGTFGDWAAVPGPEGFFWGGTWILAAQSSPHGEIIGDIMRQMAVDRDNQETFVRVFDNFVNHRGVIQDMANDPYFGSSFLGGQNHIALLVDAVETISMENVGPADITITTAFQDAFGDYFEGNVTREQAIDNFYNTVITMHPYLSDGRG